MKIDINILQQLAPTFGVAPVQMMKGLSQVISGKVGIQAEGEVAEILQGAGYTFSFNDQGYHNESQYADDDQAVYILPNGLIVWVWAKQLARGFDEPSKLAKWVSGDSKYPGGKVNKFIEVYSKAIGLGPKAPKGPEDRMVHGDEEIPSEPMPGPVPDRSGVAPAMGEADKLIAMAKKKSGVAGRLPADDIIDLYQKAKGLKKAEQKKLMDFVKTLKPMNENFIKKSSLETLIQEIVRGIVKESKGWEKGRKGGGGGWEMEKEPSTEHDSWVLDMANKIWKDPTAIKGRSGGSKWQISRVETAKTGETVYLLKKVQTIERSRFIVKRDGKWFYLDQQPDHTKKWIEIPEQPPQAAPADDKGEEPPVKEETGTGAVSPVTGPNAFKKKESIKESRNPEVNNCGYCHKALPPYSEWKWVLCPSCKKEADSSKDEQIDEMTTTGSGTTGYNIPGAFSRQMKGKSHIEVLGYTMTPAGKKEYDRKGDRLLEGKKKVDETAMGDLGSKFASAQRRYDAQVPEDDEPTRECDKCGQEAVVLTDSGSKGGKWWWWSAVCKNCGDKTGGDNFD